MPLLAFQLVPHFLPVFTQSSDSPCPTACVSWSRQPGFTDVPDGVTMKSDVIAPSPAAGYSAGFRWAGYLVGLAMGGFFDGILLHQVLQWHHLLSLVDSPVVRDVR